MKLDDLVDELRETGTSEFKLSLLRKIAGENPGLSLSGVLVKYAAHHNVTEGTIRKAREILARAEARPAQVQQQRK